MRSFEFIKGRRKSSIAFAIGQTRERWRAALRKSKNIPPSGNESSSPRRKSGPKSERRHSFFPQIKNRKHSVFNASNLKRHSIFPDNFHERKDYHSRYHRGHFAVDPAVDPRYITTPGTRVIK